MELGLATCADTPDGLMVEIGEMIRFVLREEQGSGRGRPRYPLEGRNEQVDASTQCNIHET